MFAIESGDGEHDLFPVGREGKAFHPGKRDEAIERRKRRGFERDGHDPTLAAVSDPAMFSRGQRHRTSIRTVSVLMKSLVANWSRPADQLLVNRLGDGDWGGG